MPYQDKNDKAAYDARHYAENREKIRVNHAKWRAENPVKVREHHAKYSATNQEKIKVYMAKWRAENREKVRELKAKWRAENLEKEKARQAKYRVENREKIKALKAKYRAENREEIRAWQRRHRYDMTPEGYEARLTAQGGVCAICHQPPNGKVLVVDHDHRTGKVRGLLCSSCNKGLGFLKDDSALLRAATAYLEQQ
jgi:hypothetical protein